jgi:hypothetical protein
MRRAIARCGGSVQQRHDPVDGSRFLGYKRPRSREQQKEGAMRKRDLRVHQFYTNDTALFIRQITANDGALFFYRDFSASDGKPLGVGVSACRHEAFARWAIRECTAEEIGRCDLSAADRQTEELSSTVRQLVEAGTRNDVIFPILDAIDPAHLVAYLERQGYEVKPPQPL